MMHLCDKCKKFNKCYSKDGYTEADLMKRAEVELAGCPKFNELTIHEMFAPKKGELNHGKNERH